jgi:thiamine biosynthesis protein ThiS
MLISVNGDNVDIGDGCTVSALLEMLKIGTERVAVEANLEIVPKAVYDSHVLLPGDSIEIVHFVGGG